MPKTYQGCVPYPRARQVMAQDMMAIGQGKGKAGQERACRLKDPEETAQMG